ncbi:MAG: choice-of-anchor D domain-containing protein, partial [Nitrospirae bacterium]|nr:choice-of-anchor D domain-containing protein [Nitrospirota bacterium]
MKTKKLVWTFFVCFLVLFLAIPSIMWSATFNVSDIPQFQSALTLASSNGEDDTINVAAGTYTLTSTLTYTSTGTENHSLEIIGASSGSTILFGGNTAQILSINTVEPDADISVRYIEFQNGNSSGNGGGLNISVDSSDISVERCEFNNNSAVVTGGGASLVSNSGSVTLQYCAFNNNYAGNDGAGLSAWTDTGTISISNSSFDNNSTADTGGDDGGGASAITVSGQVTVTNNTFSNNESGDDGAGLFTYVEGEGGDITISNNTFTHNIAGLGGGGSFTRINLSGTVTLTNNTFTNNSTLNGSGGGSLVYCQSGSVSFTGNDYSNNTTSVSGGEPDGAGVWTWIGSGSLTLTANRFYHNDAGRNGGGLSLNSETGTITLANNIFHNNSAVNVGGGISIATSTATAGFYNDTFHNNSAADGGGIDFYSLSSSTNVHIYNAIIWDSTPQAISESGVGRVLAVYSDIEGGTGQSWFGTGCIDLNPLFTDPTNGGFQLQAGSPCIDSGNSSPWIPSTDFDGNPRVSGTEVDMGAFEYGSGVSDAPNISVSPSSNDFGSITIGSSSLPQTFTISNTGTADLDISAMSIIGGDSSQFILQLGTCTSLTPTISQGGSCTVTVTFSPT